MMTLMKRPRPNEKSEPGKVESTAKSIKKWKANPSNECIKEMPCEESEGKNEIVGDIHSTTCLVPPLHMVREKIKLYRK
jgi:hypothetical protein